MTTHDAPRPAPVLLDGCTCGGVGGAGSHYYGCAWSNADRSLAYDDSGDLVPGWHDSPQGRADAADQARWDRQETRTNG